MRTYDQIGLARALLRARVLKRYRHRMRLRRRRLRTIMTRFNFRIDMGPLRRLERQMCLVAARLRRVAMFRDYQAAMPGWWTP
jgi:hypothetical protein